MAMRTVLMLFLVAATNASAAFVNDSDVSAAIGETFAAHPEAPTAASVAAAIVIGDQVYYATHNASGNTTFQIGSISKPVTGAMQARAIELGYMGWDTTIGQVLPGVVASGVPSTYSNVSVSMLNAHTSGIRYHPSAAGGGNYEYIADTTDRRHQYTIDALKDAQLFVPGEGYNYGGGTNISTFMLETITGQSYEQLMENLLFTPRGMTSAGLDAPQTGEFRYINGVMYPRSLFDSAVDGRYVGSPVGGISMSVKDMGRFAQLVLTGGTPFYGVEGVKRLRQAPGNTYFSSGGFSIDSSDGAGGLKQVMNGCNGYNYASLAIYPARNAAVIAMTNYTDESGKSATIIPTLLSKLKDILTAKAGAAANPFAHAASLGETASASSSINFTYGPGKAFDGNLFIGDFDSRWATSSSTSTAWVQSTWTTPATVSRALVVEPTFVSCTTDVPCQPFRTISWSLYLRVDGAWQFATWGKDLGRWREISFPLTSGVTGVRLNVNGPGGPSLREVHVLWR